MVSWLLVLLSMLLGLVVQTTQALEPTAYMEVWSGGNENNENHKNDENTNYKTYFVSQATFGPLSPTTTKKSTSSSSNIAQSTLAKHLVLAPTDNPLLCQNITGTTPHFPDKAIAVVPRGVCTYQQKALRAQQLGASAIVIYNTLSSRYGMNETKKKHETRRRKLGSGGSSSSNKKQQQQQHATTSTTTSTSTTSASFDDILWPLPKFDYDCSKGSAQIPTSALSFATLPYDSSNDKLLSSLSNDPQQPNLCVQYSTTTANNNHLDQCDSKLCLLTNPNIDAQGNERHHHYTSPNETEFFQACCAWDLHQILYNDPTVGDPSRIHIPAVFMTMQDGMDLVARIMQENNDASLLSAVIYSRWRPEYNISSLLIWMLGVAVAALASYASAGDYRTALATWRRRYQLQLQLSSRDSNTAARDRTATNSTAPLAKRSPSQEESLELEPIHALGFLVMASSSLFILFYFKIYGVVKVMYAFGCSNAIVEVITQPLVLSVMTRLGVSPRVVVNNESIGRFTTADVLAAVLGYTWGMIWLYMALFVLHPDTYTFFWVSQNILGTCMCITFLGLIRLNSIQVASVLLIVAFLYDIFFVFITPLLFSESIMITVATSGGPPKADALWCEKYPRDADCQGGDPLPMLLTVPRVWDYLGGSNLLGLGDIILPGLLLSFAARLDAAKALVAFKNSIAIGSGSVGTGGSSNDGWSCCWGCCSFRSTNGPSSNSTSTSGSYFWPMVVAYAVGLLMANMAVYLMNYGQPALLYLVPCTLGTMTYLGYQRRELQQLWELPPELAQAEEIVYGNAHPHEGGAGGLRSTEGVELGTPRQQRSTGGSRFLDEPPENDMDDENEDGMGNDNHPLLFHASSSNTASSAGSPSTAE